MTQKQTKSKARMIKNILHTSNFNTEKKRNNMQKGGHSFQGNNEERFFESTMKQETTTEY